MSSHDPSGLEHDAVIRALQSSLRDAVSAKVAAESAATESHRRAADLAERLASAKVGRCTLTLSKPELNAAGFSA